jgi:hypothetical protein
LASKPARQFTYDYLTVTSIVVALKAKHRDETISGERFELIHRGNRSWLGKENSESDAAFTGSSITERVAIFLRVSKR